MSTAAERTHSSDGTLHEHDGAGRGDSVKNKPGPRQVSLWSSELKAERTAYLKQWLLALTSISVFMFAALPIYWGAYFRQPQNLYRLTVALIDLDSPGSAALGRTPLLGPALLAAPAQLDAARDRHLGFVEVDNTPFDISNVTGEAQRGLNVWEWAMHAVVNEDYFGVIVAAPNATVQAVSAYEQVASGAQSVMYDPSGALTLYYAEGRNFETEDQWIAPGMTNFINQYVTGAAASALLSQLTPRLGAISADEYAGVNTTALGSILAMPFGYSLWNLRPVDQFAAIPATSVGMLYLLIFTYFVSLFWNNARMAIEPKLRLKDLVILRLLVPIVQYVFISLWISLVTLAFQVSFDRWWGKGGFPLFWASNFLCQWALGMYMEIALIFLGPKYTAFFLIIDVILNVSVAFIDLADQDHFYSYGFAIPVYQAVQIAKSIIFGTKSRMGQYFGINIAWAVCGTLLLAAAVVFKRKRQEREKATEKAQEKEKTGQA
ncbi:hypothetical protein JCM6882_001788 [Rhodosporidiobolus microsporus]